MRVFLRRLANLSTSRDGSDNAPGGSHIRQLPHIERFRGHNASGYPYHDLIDRLDITFALLDDTRIWRERTVHEVVLRDSDHVDVSTTCQVHIPLDLIQRFKSDVKAGDRVRLLLPFAVLQKQLLFNVDFTGFACEPSALMLRERTAELQARYLAYLDNRLFGKLPLRDAIGVGVSLYTSAYWREYEVRAKPRVCRRLLPGWRDSWRIKALSDYLSIGLKLEVEPRHVRHWLHKIEPARFALVKALGEGEYATSSSECILLAIPFMPFPPRSIDQIDEIVVEFCEMVDSMGERARKLFAEYGRRWEVIVDTVVPVQRSCSLKLSEQRPWTQASSSIMKQVLPFGDSATTHVEIRAADHSVEIKHQGIYDTTGERIGLAGADEIRKTADIVAIYNPTATERCFQRVHIRVRVRPVHGFLIRCLILIMFVVCLAATALPDDDSLVGSLSLLVLPVTLVGAIVISLESTPLAERLLKRKKICLVSAMTVLWFVTLYRLHVHTAIMEMAMSVWTQLSVWIKLTSFASWF